MKKLLISISLLWMSIMAYSQDEPKIAIFCDHIETIAKQEHITFAEAAVRVRSIGFTGTDVWVTQNTIELDLLQSLGFEFPCAILDVNYCVSDCKDAENAALDFMKRYKIDKVLIVVGLMREGSEDHDFEAVKKRVAAFAQRAEKEGIKVLLEDYDNAASPCYNLERLTNIFANCEMVGHVFDSGNYLFAGDDCLVALDKFKKNVGHVHLKDRVSAEDMSCPAVGDGCIPIKKAVKTLKAAGYKGWYTVEFFDNPSMLSAAEKSYKFVSKAVK